MYHSFRSKHVYYRTEMRPENCKLFSGTLPEVVQRLEGPSAREHHHRLRGAAQRRDSAAAGRVQCPGPNVHRNHRTRTNVTGLNLDFSIPYS